MRQWHLPPKFMCNQHLLGEHVEHHMFAGTILKGGSVSGYVKGYLFIPLTLYPRHNILVREMVDRGIRHQSPLPEVSIKKLLELSKGLPYWGMLNMMAHYEDLAKRCSKCARLAPTAEMIFPMLATYWTTLVRPYNV